MISAEAGDLILKDRMTLQLRKVTVKVMYNRQL
jgi:hypothetical protein